MSLDLESILRARLAAGSPLAAIEEHRGGLVRLMFPALGSLPRVVLEVVGNEIIILSPAAEPEPFEEAPVADINAHQQTANVQGAAEGSQPNPPPPVAPNPAPAEPEQPPAEPPVWIDYTAYSKAALLDIARGPVNADVEDGWTKAEIAAAINAKTGATQPE